MDIVIPYHQDKHDGLELRFTLRSIEKYLSGWNVVYLIGDKPSWFTGCVIPAKDVPGRKEFSIKQKILSVCDYFHLSDNILMYHDDHFLLKPLHVSEIKYWYDGLLTAAHKLAHSGYKTPVARTLIDYPDGKNFDIHTPIIFNKEKFKQVMTWTDEQCVKSTYCNASQIEGEQMTDMKINRPMVRAEIMAKIAGRLFFSTGPIAMVGDMVEVFEELYPAPGLFEK